jgi:hypothetical protein
MPRGGIIVDTTPMLERRTYHPHPQRSGLGSAAAMCEDAS